MANGKDSNLLLALGLGALGWYIWQRSQAQAAAGQIVPGTTITPVPLAPGFGPQGPPAPVSTAPTPEQTLAAGVGAAVQSATGIPGSGAVASAITSTELNAAENIVHGTGTPLSIAKDVATVVEFPVAVTVTAINAVSNLFGWSGHPLDTINDVLLAQITDPTWNVKDNVPPAAAIYAMDTAGTLHYIQHAANCGGDTLWCAHYSWREIIAVPPDVFNKFSIGGDITDRSQIDPMGRPSDPSLIRNVFGPYSRFKVGTTELYGPWDLGLGASAQADAQAAAVAAAAVAAAQQAALQAAAVAQVASGVPHVANEGQVFSMAADGIVYYGAGGSWNSVSTGAGSHYCDNGTFGPDPNVGNAKECRSAAPIAQPPAPTPWGAVRVNPTTGQPEIYYGYWSYYPPPDDSGNWTWNPVSLTYDWTYVPPPVPDFVSGG